MNSTLPVMEHFYTLQGEGANAGMPAYFIRLGGCDVGCHWCDVKESWDIDKHPHIAVDELVRLVCESGAPNAVITGGEPAMHNLEELTTALRSMGIKTWIETSGAHPLTGTWDWICVSPKKFKPALDSVLKQANELKIIIFHTSDFAWAEGFRNKVPRQAQLFLQPEWEKSGKNLPEIIAYIKLHPAWRISLQTHKYLNIP